MDIHIALKFEVTQCAIWIANLQNYQYPSVKHTKMKAVIFRQLKYKTNVTI